MVTTPTREQIEALREAAEPYFSTGQLPLVDPEQLIALCALALQALDTRKELAAACGYMRNAKIDLETGAKKATTIATLEGGLKRAETFLKALPAPEAAS